MAIGFSIGALVAGATVAFASIPHSTSGQITGCYSARSGALRVIDAQAGQTCARGETQISWNQTGPQGPVGDSSNSQYGTLYAGATYRLSLDGCPSGHVKLVRASAAGTNLDYFPAETQCATPTYNSAYGVTLSWPMTTTLTRTDQALLYRGGGNAFLGTGNLGPDVPDEFQGGRIDIWIDLYDLNSPSKNPRMELTFSFWRYTPSPPTVDELAPQFLQWAIDNNVMPDPLVLYQVP